MTARPPEPRRRAGAGRRLLALAAAAAVSVQAAAPVGAQAEGGEGRGFLLFGRPLSERADRMDRHALARYRRAFAKFPDLESCLDRDPAAGEIGQAALDWRALATFEQVNWCVFLLADRLRDPDRLRARFEAAGFTVSLRPKPPVIMRHYDHDGPGLILNASVAISDSPVVLPWYDRLGAYSL